MSKKWITILVAAVIGALLMPSAAFATCRLQVVTAVAYTDATNGANSGADPLPYVAGDKISLVTPTLDGGTGLTINAEGVSERVADLLISDDGAGTFCFTAGNDLVITYNAVLTSPPTPGNLSIPGNLDIFDSNGIGGLTVTSATVTQVFAANTTNSQLDIKIGQTGTAGDLEVGPNGAAIRVKNVRVNASLTAGAGATVSATFLGNFGTVATAQSTIGASVQPGAIAAGGIGGGTQSSGKGLAVNQTIGMTEGFGTAFRTAGGTCASRTAASDTCYSQVANDIATVATSMVFTVTGIPSGVTVTFPSSISTSAVSNSSNSLTFASRSGAAFTNSGAAGNLTAIYDTTKNGAAANALTIETADNADAGTSIGTTAGTSNPNCTINSTPALVNLNNGSLCDANPKIGVKVASASLSGTTKLWWAFGRADVGGSLFTGDDVAADTTVIPRYTGTARLIVNNKSFFTIFPTRTTLLFPFVSSFGKFNTGLSVANTCNDAGAFATTATCTTAGGVTFFFYGVNPDTGATVVDSVNSDLTAGGTSLSAACRGLDATTGRIAAGTEMACALTNLLPLLPTKPSNFDGYVIAVTGFNFAHGFSAQFNAAGAPFAANPALVIGLNGATTRVGGESAGN